MFPNLLNLSWLTTSKFSFYGELPTLTFWELKPNSAWGSLTLLDQVLLNNLNYCKAWLAWHKTAERLNLEGQSQSSGWWRSWDAVTELEISQTCLHHCDMEVRNAALRSHVLWPTLQTEAEKRQILQPRTPFTVHYDKTVQAQRWTLPLQKFREKAELRERDLF